MPVLNTEALINERVSAIQAAMAAAGAVRGQLDLSGGIDSAVMLGVLVLAQGPENITLDHTDINTNSEQTERAKALAKALGVPLAIGRFTDICAGVVQECIRSLLETAPQGPWWGGPGLKGPKDRLREEIHARIDADPTILGSIRSTLRAPLGRAYGRIMGGGLRFGTGNECEDRFLRFYQKGGDGEVDNNPLAFLSKGEVYQLAVALGKRFDAMALAAILSERDLTPEDDVQAVSRAFRAIIEAVPSPDLWGEGDGHSDETEFLSWTGAPFTYSRVDPDTGEYTSVGTIERVSRFLDLWFAATISGKQTMGEVLFGDDLDRTTFDVLVTQFIQSGLFPVGSPHSYTAPDLLQAARKAEAQTRHKMNPNCPTYGNRAALVEQGILTNDFPVLVSGSCG